VIGTFFAARFIDPDLSPSAIDAAFRIYMLPQGMFSVAVATVLFPRSRPAARNDLESFQHGRYRLRDRLPADSARFGRPR
jgi:peptidoglycan biosynthesis protein MviN/MurJ (putative lipid II flippase)